MARIRSIKPDFWTSEQVAECSPIARLLFIGLWNFCDDAGAHPASLKAIKMRIFPADDISTEEMRELVFQLEAVGLLARYVVEDIEYFQVTGWHHQRIDKPQEPKFPRPVNGFLTTINKGADSTIDQRTLFDQSLSDRDQFPDRSLLDRIGRDRIGREETPPIVPPNGDENHNHKHSQKFDHEFDQFWEVVAHKVGKPAARTAFAKQRKQGVQLDTLISGFTHYVETKPTTREWLNPATWLNQRRWEDQPANASEAPRPDIDRIMAELDEEEAQHERH